jgi:hypothetical protein
MALGLLCVFGNGPPALDHFIAKRLTATRAC